MILDSAISPVIYCLHGEQPRLCIFGSLSKAWPRLCSPAGFPFFGTPAGKARSSHDGTKARQPQWPSSEWLPEGEEPEAPQLPCISKSEKLHRAHEGRICGPDLRSRESSSVWDDHLERQERHLTAKYPIEISRGVHHLPGNPFLIPHQNSLIARGKK